MSTIGKFICLTRLKTVTLWHSRTDRHTWQSTTIYIYIYVMQICPKIISSLIGKKKRVSNKNLFLKKTCSECKSLVGWCNFAGQYMVHHVSMTTCTGGDGLGSGKGYSSISLHRLYAWYDVLLFLF